MFAGYQSVGPYRPQYFCPRQGPVWQGNKIVPSLPQAIGWAKAVKPQGPNAQCRVVDARGIVVFQE